MRLSVRRVDLVWEASLSAVEAGDCQEVTLAGEAELAWLPSI